MNEELERIAAHCSHPDDVRRQCNPQHATPSQEACYEAWNRAHPQFATCVPAPEQAWPFNWFGK